MGSLALLCTLSSVKLRSTFFLHLTLFQLDLEQQSSEMVLHLLKCLVGPAALGGELLWFRASLVY